MVASPNFLTYEQLVDMMGDEDRQRYEQSILKPNGMSMHAPAVSSSPSFSAKPSGNKNYWTEEDLLDMQGLAPGQQDVSGDSQGTPDWTDIPGAIGHGIARAVPRAAEDFARSARSYKASLHGMKVYADPNDAATRFIDWLNDRTADSRAQDEFYAKNEVTRSLAQGLESSGTSLASGVPGFLVGNLAGGPLAGVATGMATTYPVFYGMAKDTTLDLLARKTRELNPNMTDAQLVKILQDAESNASEAGLWEAGTEALTEGITMALSFGLGKMGGKQLLKSVVQDIVGKAYGRAAAKVAGSAALEIAGETATEKNQGRINKELGITDKAPTWGEAFREIAGPTLVMSGAHQGLFGTSEYMGIRKNQKMFDVATNAAQTVGVDPTYMAVVAGRESGFNPNSTSKTSTATGLFGITNGTFRALVKQYGQQYGFTMADKNRPEINALAAALLTRDNAVQLEKAIGRTPTNGELYLAHFFGADQAVNFLQNLVMRPDAPAATVFGREAKANKSIFYDKQGRPNSLLDVYKSLTSKFGNAREFGVTAFDPEGIFEDDFSFNMKDYQSPGHRLVEEAQNKEEDVPTATDRLRDMDEASASAETWKEDTSFETVDPFKADQTSKTVEEDVFPFKDAGPNDLDGIIREPVQMPAEEDDEITPPVPGPQANQPFDLLNMRPSRSNETRAEGIPGKTQVTPQAKHTSVLPQLSPIEEMFRQMQEQQAQAGMAHQQMQAQRQAPPVPSPEPASNTQAQLEAILDPRSSKKAMLVTPGSPVPQHIPQGVHQIPTMHGLVLTADPAIAQAIPFDIDEQRLGQFLLDYPMGRPEPLSGIVVQALDEQGRIVSETQTDTANAHLAVQSMKAHSPTGNVRVVPTPQALQERKQAVANEQPAMIPASEIQPFMQAPQTGVLPGTPLAIMLERPTGGVPASEVAQGMTFPETGVVPGEPRTSEQQHAGTYYSAWENRQDGSTEDFSKWIRRKHKEYQDATSDSQDQRGYKERFTEWLSTPEKVEQKHAAQYTVVLPSELPFEQAYAAYKGSSFSPENRARSVQREFADHIQGLYDSLKSRVGDERQGDLREAIRSYKEGYRSKLLAALAADSRTVSSMITGRANFPTRRNQKRLDSAQKRWMELTEWSRKAQARMESSLGIATGQGTQRIEVGEVDAVAKLESRIAEMRKQQEYMKDVNVRYRKAKGDIDSMDVDEKTKKVLRLWQANHEKALGDSPFPAYMLSNNLANIKRLEKRLAESRALSENIREPLVFDGGEIIDNVNENRVQIYFDEKPPVEMRESLKKHGFRWAPRNQVWQRQRTAEALKVAIELTEADADAENKSQSPQYREAVKKSPDTVKKYPDTVPTESGHSSEALNKKDGEAGNGEETFRLEDAPIDPTTFKALLKKINNGKISAAEIKTWFEAFRDNADHVQAELSKMTKKKLLEEFPSLRRQYGNEKKEVLVQGAYEHILRDFNLSDALTFNPMVKGARLKAIEDAVASQTDDDVAAHAKRVQERNEEYKNALEAHRKALKNPETLDEFHTFIQSRGEDALSTEQRRKYEALKAEVDFSQRQEQKNTIEGVALNEDIQWERDTVVSRKGDGDLIILRPSTRLGTEKFKELASSARKIGGGYARFAKGFYFLNDDQAERFLKLTQGESVSREAELQQGQKTKRERLLALADRMEAAADESLSQDRQQNTARRARMAASAESSANESKRTAQTIRRIADAAERGELRYLSELQHATQLEELERTLYLGRHARALKTEKGGEGRYEDERQKPYSADDIDNAKFPVHTMTLNAVLETANDLDDIKGAKRIEARFREIARMLKRDEDNIYSFTSEEDRSLIESAMSKLKKAGGSDRWGLEETQAGIKRLNRMGITNDATLREALREYLPLREDTLTADPIKEAERALVGRKIDGYFPTPSHIAEDMVDRLDVQPGMTVLEPSAGKGNLLDALAQSHPDVEVEAIEPVQDLRTILESKGHKVAGRDFMEHEGQYDRILMNPPFENGQDMDHVRRAYDQLKPGGKLVAIMSEGTFFRTDKKSNGFREWLDAVDGVSEKLPEGSFKSSERPTGVATRLVEIEKPEHDAAYQRDKRTRSRPIPLEHVQALVNWVNDIGADIPRVDVIETHHELPVAIIKQTDNPKTINAVYHNGRIWLVAARMKSDKDVADAITHELRHFGLRTLLGKQWGPVMHTALKNKAVQEKIRELGLGGYEYQGKNGQYIMAEEAITHLADDGWTGGLWHRIVANVRRFLRKLFPDLAFSDSEVRNLIARTNREIDRRFESARKTHDSGRGGRMFIKDDPVFQQADMGKGNIEKSYSKDKPAETFLEAPGGGIDFGHVTDDMAQAMGSRPGPIRLQNGNVDFGALHIIERHKYELQRHGYNDPSEYVSFITKHFDAVFQGNTQRHFVLSVREGRTWPAAVVKMEYDPEGEFYRVVTASPVRKDQYVRSDGTYKKNLLWEGTQNLHSDQEGLAPGVISGQRSSQENIFTDEKEVNRKTQNPESTDQLSTEGIDAMHDFLDGKTDPDDTPTFSLGMRKRQRQRTVESRQADHATTYKPSKKDLSRFSTMVSQPQAVARQDERFRPVFERALRRYTERMTKYHSILEDAGNFFDIKDPAKLNALRDVIWKYDGKDIPKVDAGNIVPSENAAGKPLKDKRGNFILERNKVHYVQIRKALQSMGVDQDVATAYARVRYALDGVLLDAYNLMISRGEFTRNQIDDFRKAMGRIRNYFPHNRYGKYFVQIKVRNHIATGEDNNGVPFYYVADAFGRRISREFTRRIDAVKLMRSTPGKELSMFYRGHYDISLADRVNLAGVREYTDKGRLKELYELVGDKVRDQAIREFLAPKGYAKEGMFTVEYGENEKLPDDLFELPLQTDAMVKIVEEAAKSVSDPGAREAVLNALPEEIANVMKTRGFGSHFIQRANIHGFEKQDIHKVLTDYAANASGWLTKLPAAGDFARLLNDIPANTRTYTYAREYVRDQLRNADDLDRIVANIKTAIFVKYLGGNLKTAAVNLTQNIVIGWPMLAAETDKNGAKAMTKASSDYLVDVLTGKKSLPKDEQRLLMDLMQRGELQAQFLREIKGRVSTSLSDKASHVTNRIVDCSGWPMHVAETFNRTAMALAAYRLARDGKITSKESLNRFNLHQGRANVYANARDFAEHMVREAHFVYGKENLPPFARGGTLNRSVLYPAYTFMTHTHSQFSLWWHWLTRGTKAQRKALAKSMAAQVALGGLRAAPVFVALSVVAQMLSDDGEDLEEKIRKAMPQGPAWNRNLFRDMVTYGAPSALGVTFGGSMMMNVPGLVEPKPAESAAEMFDRSLLSLFGVPYDLAKTPFKMADAYVNSGSAWKAIKPLMPTAVNNAMTALDLYTEGHRAQSGKPLNLPGEQGPSQLSATEAVAKGMGFQPVKLTKEYDAYTAMKWAEASRTRALKRFGAKLADAMRNGEDTADIYEELKAWNERARRRNKPHLVISAKDLRRAVKYRSEAKRPSRRMRFEAEDINELYQ
ncbi:PLxRFG domain-containing protein [Desulfovibrio inopinatus]|uniref:PLxRFG domain-containing protein n=1 Tax=Desulfovibrio inopinatus TaxID=102109 RepID=UPI0003F90674|nr:PLxRFG domain-containing protein [Desulfovibrio inopinatus]